MVPAFHGRDGRGPYGAGDEAAIKAIMEATEARTSAAYIVIDYGHQSVFSAICGIDGRAPAAGWLKDYDVWPDGIWGRLNDGGGGPDNPGPRVRLPLPDYWHTKAGGVLHIVCRPLERPEPRSL